MKESAQISGILYRGVHTSVKSRSGATVSKPVDVLAAGLNVVDILVCLPETTQRDAKHELAEISTQGGGPAGNVACVIASPGWRTVSIAPSKICALRRG